MRKLTFYLLSIFLLQLCGLGFGAIPTSEREALIALYNSTNGDNWTNKSGWKTPPLHTDGFSMPGTEKNWYGVTVYNDSVVELRLSNNQLKGIIPRHLGNLSKLQYLDLRQNQLIGGIPSEIDSLKNLKAFFLENSLLSDTIPEQSINLNDYKDLLSNTQAGLPDLTLYQPAGWTDKILVSYSQNANTDDIIYANQQFYIGYCAKNIGTADITSGFWVKIWVDGSLNFYHYWSSPLLAGYYFKSFDHPVSLSAGPHKIKVMLDSDYWVAESDENNNILEKNINVISSSTKPTVSTNPVYSITTNSAVSGGNVTSDGGATVTGRGVCWNTSIDPTIYNSNTNNGSGTGSFTSSIFGLTPNTTYYVRAYATNSAGTNYGENVRFTTIPSTPTAAFSASPTSGNAPLLVQFIDESLPGDGASITGWSWNFGDGTTSSSQNPSHTYNSSGSYNVILTVTNSFGKTSTITKSNYITVNQTQSTPRAIFSASPISGKAPLNVQFTDESLPGDGATITQWSWNFGDGSSSTSSNPSHTYNSPGIYTVTLTVTNTFGKSNTAQNLDYISVEQATTIPTAAFSASPRSGASPLTVKFTDQSQAGSGANLTEWRWDFGDGGTSASQNPSHTYNSTGLYTVTLTVTNSFDKSNSLEKSDYIDVQQASASPIASFYASPTTGAAPFSVQFIDESQAGEGATITGWWWNFGDGASSSNQNPQHTYNSPGTYTVSLTITNSFNKQNTHTESNYIYVQQSSTSPMASFSASPTSGSIPLTVWFTDESQPGEGATITKWSWNFGDGTTSNNQFPSHTYNSSGSYTVSLTVTNSFNKQNTHTEYNYINVSQSSSGPTASFSASPTTGSAPLTVQFTDQSSPGTGASITNWSWNFGDGSTGSEQNPTHTYSTAGYFTVSLTVTNSAGKTNKSTKNNYIHVEQQTIPTLWLNRTNFNFGAIVNGTKTSDETLIIKNTGGGLLNWSITNYCSWLTISKINGSNTDKVKISMNANGLPSGYYSGYFIVSAPNATNAPQTVNVNLVVKTSQQSQAPFGEMSTPMDNSSVSSSIPVTGWALDDTEVTGVKIYNNNVYVGDAVFIEGSRPDVQMVYPSNPFNYKAGWGYMLLTNFLPNGGNGKYTITAKAYDNEGHETILGNKTIYCDNAHATKPFGAIDTPTQGGTAASKDYVNFGWVLTPQPNYIPANGSTLSVYVDGIYKGHPVYNTYRSDIAQLLPGYYNSYSAGGYFYLDTTQYTDGIHTISWQATDNAGNTDGIGSRYFSILNTTSNLQESISTTETASRIDIPVHSSLKELDEMSCTDTFYPLLVQKGFDPSTEPKLIYPDENGVIDIEIEELERLQLQVAGCLTPVEEVGRFLEKAPQKLLIGEDKNIDSIPNDSRQPNRQGCNPLTQITDTDTLTGYMVVGDELQELPIGSTLDQNSGTFYWQPGPGFLGEYRLVFVFMNENGERVKKNIIITISPKR